MFFCKLVYYLCGTKANNMNQTINSIINFLESKGFEYYSDFSHTDRIEYKGINILHMTCTKGEYNGDVAEVWYNFHSGEIVSKNTYSQFLQTEPKLKF